MLPTILTFSYVILTNLIISYNTISIKILHQGIATLLKSDIIEILAEVSGTTKVVELLRKKFTFTAAEMAKNFQDSYGYAMAAITSGLATPENQRGFWQ